MGGDFVLILKLARTWLSLPSSETEAERAFSHAGRVVDDERSNLDPRTVSNKVYCARNLKFVRDQINDRRLGLLLLGMASCLYI